jgi:menaquinone-dependent protoporphyrinogen oxidase
MGAVLVAYATKNGSTRQVAEALAARLRAQGATLECRPARSVRTAVGGFDLVVVGGALYNGRWHGDAHGFHKRHRHQLAAVAVFGKGPRSDDAQAWARSRAQLDRAPAKHPWLAPITVAVIGGLDPPGKHAHRDQGDWSASPPGRTGSPTPAAAASRPRRES